MTRITDKPEQTIMSGLNLVTCPAITGALSVGISRPTHATDVSVPTDYLQMFKSIAVVLSVKAAATLVKEVPALQLGVVTTITIIEARIRQLEATITITLHAVQTRRSETVKTKTTAVAQARR